MKKTWIRCIFFAAFFWMIAQLVMAQVYVAPQPNLIVPVFAKPRENAEGIIQLKNWYCYGVRSDGLEEEISYSQILPGFLTSFYQPVSKVIGYKDGLASAGSAPSSGSRRLAKRYRVFFSEDDDLRRAEFSDWLFANLERATGEFDWVSIRFKYYLVSCEDRRDPSSAERTLLQEVRVDKTGKDGLL